MSDDGPVEKAGLSARARQLMRTDALDTAETLLQDRGYRGLRMQDVAERVGVARQTLYTEFGSKHELATAVVLRLTERFLEGVEQALNSEDSPQQSWAAAVRYTLDTAADNPLLKTILIDDGSGELLPLLTTEAAPVVQAARDRITTTLQKRWPNLHPPSVTVAAEAAARLALSHVMLPLHPTEQVADDISRVLISFLGDPHHTH